MPDRVTLWIENSGLGSAEIREACASAEAVIASSGVTIREAYDASLAEADGREFNSAAAAAWRAAEQVALANVAAESAILSIA